MRKKLLSGLLAMVMVFTMALPALAAQPQPKLELEYSRSGDTVDAVLSITGNPGITAVQATLSYDRTVLQCTGCRAGSLISGLYTQTNRNGANGAVLAAAGSEPVTGDGPVAIYSFKVLGEGDPAFDLKDVVLSDEKGKGLSVSVSVREAPAGDPVTPPEEPVGFVDIDGHWAQGYIERAGLHGLINGYGNGVYGPDDTMTRAHFVTILWRSAGSPEPKSETSFPDVPAGQYYSKAVAWAKENGVVNGFSPDQFCPQSEVTREQIAATLHRMAGNISGMELMLTGIYDDTFTDSANLRWSKQSVYWAVYNGVWCGRDSVEVHDTLYNNSFATRAEIAVMIVNYLSKIKGEAI